MTAISPFRRIAYAAWGILLLLAALIIFQGIERIYNWSQQWQHIQEREQRLNRLTTTPVVPVAMLETYRASLQPVPSFEAATLQSFLRESIAQAGDFESFQSLPGAQKTLRASVVALIRAEALEPLIEKLEAASLQIESREVQKQGDNIRLSLSVAYGGGQL
jgi:hypothetical protein